VQIVEKEILIVVADLFIVVQFIRNYFWITVIRCCRCSVHSRADWLWSV